MSATTATAAPFTFNRNYNDYEQVRPYFADYCEVLAAVTAAGAYPYNDTFKGRIASLAGTHSKNEDTAIYMLQSMHRRDQDVASRDAFVASGGFLADMLKGTEGTVRGDLAVFGEYSGGTGWRVISGVRVEYVRNGVYYYPARARNPRYVFGGTLYFRPAMTTSTKED